jgi:ABC-type multidrug transport system fused ATPase/permease subunit
MQLAACRLFHPDILLILIDHMKKWNTIKKACAKEAFSAITSATLIGELGAMISVVSMRVTLVQGYRESRQHDKVRNTLANQVYDAIMNWDVRSFESLRDLYPKHFPKGKLTAYMRDDEDQTWVIDTQQEYA